MVSLIQHFEADFLWKVSLKMLNSDIILKTFPHASLKRIISRLAFLQFCLTSCVLFSCVFVTFPCVLIHFRTKGEVGTVNHV